MDNNDKLFTQLIYMFHTSAMHGLGRIVDPSGKKDVNLGYVKETIDLMEMLKIKTVGNIPEDIVKLLENMLLELSEDYIEEKEKFKLSNKINS